MVFPTAIATNPRIIFVGTIEPTDKTEGLLWYDTTTNITKVSNGTSYVDVADVDITFLELQQLQQAVAIIALEADASVTSQDYTTMYVDKFSDSNGYDNSVNTTNTTANFNTNLYENNAVDTIENQAVSLTTLGVGTGKSGMKLTMTEERVLLSITKDTDSEATIGYLLDSSKSVLATSGTFSGQVATFASPPTLSNSTTYYITTDQGGASHNSVWDTESYPTSGTSLNWIAGLNPGGVDQSGQAWSLDSVTWRGLTANKIIETSVATVATASTHSQLFCNNTLAGTGAITYDVSVDNGSTFTTGLALNTKNAITSTTGTQLIIKINLNGTGTGNTATATDYAMMLWY